MEKRLYFVIGDFVSNVIVATAAVAVTTWLIGGSWGMIPGMIVGMVLGMIIAVPLSLTVFFPILGVMEVMAPCMLSGMLGGMWGGMWPLDGAGIVRWGAGTGVGVVVVIYALNLFMTGEQQLEG